MQSNMTIRADKPLNPRPEDSHIVVASIVAEDDGRFLGYSAVSAPLTWQEAAARWEWLDKSRRSAAGFRYAGPRRAGGRIAHYAVRSTADPRFAPLVGRGYATTRSETGRVKAARRWGKAHGYVGKGGGWIYGPGQSRPLCQGWDSLAFIAERRGGIAQGTHGKWYVIGTGLVA
jgi:hypothetical protein